MTIELNENERVDDLLIKGYKIIQNTTKFCFGMDAVLLSWFANIKRGEKVLDIGTGTGIIPLLLKAKTEGKHFTGLEIQEEMVQMAKRSVSMNDLDDDIDIITGDVKSATDIFPRESFSVITTNPPYMKATDGFISPDDAKALSRHEVSCNLEDIVSNASALLKVSGRFYMVHRPYRLAEIVSVMKKYHLEPKRMQLVYPFIDKEPNMLLIEGIKGAKSDIKVEKPLIVYESPGNYTPEIHKIYGN